MNDSEKLGHVFTALSAVKREVNATGVPKERENKQAGYKYRGVDDALDLLSGPLARADLMAMPQFETISRGVLETSTGKAMSHVIVKCWVIFVSLKDGSTFTTGEIEGEGTDMLASATSKACSVAYRNLMYLTFTVPFGAEEQEQGNGEIGLGETGEEPVRQKSDVIDVSVSQGKLLDAKLKQIGKDREWMLKEYGGFDGKGINAALDFIAKHKVDAS